MGGCPLSKSVPITSPAIDQEEIVKVAGAEPPNTDGPGDDSLVHIMNWLNSMRSRNTPNANVDHGFSPRWSQSWRRNPTGAARSSTGIRRRKKSWISPIVARQLGTTRGKPGSPATCSCRWGGRRRFQPPHKVRRIIMGFSLGLLCTAPRVRSVQPTRSAVRHHCLKQRAFATLLG